MKCLRRETQERIAPYLPQRLYGAKLEDTELLSITVVGEIFNT